MKHSELRHQPRHVNPRIQDKQYTVPQCTFIGKVCEDDPFMMIPNESHLKFFLTRRFRMFINYDESIETNWLYGSNRMGLYQVKALQRRCDQR